ncbi:MAG: hypothetical protein IPF99_40975 [Deltaproteobacteria bacterium]|nr:hypothetical protein [Deltaproteobacteria bacterium]
MKLGRTLGQPQYRLSALAQRWQLQMVDGDPSYNLFINSRDAKVAQHKPPIAGMSRATRRRTARAWSGRRAATR